MTGNNDSLRDVFINDLPKILNFQCVPFLALPKVYQELFNGWVEDVKQQSWDGWNARTTDLARLLEAMRRDARWRNRRESISLLDVRVRLHDGSGCAEPACI
jgi:hypothetical protein